MVGYKFLSDFKEAPTCKDAWILLCEHLSLEFGDSFFEDYNSFCEKNGLKALFRLSTEGMSRPRSIGHSSFYAETKGDRDAQRRITKKILEFSGYKSSDFQLIVKK